EKPWLRKALLEVFEDGDRLGDDEVPVLQDRNLTEGVQAAELRTLVGAPQEVDLDLLVRDVLLAQHDADAAGHDRERMPVEPDHAVMRLRARAIRTRPGRCRS